MYNNKRAIKLKVVGIIRAKEDVKISLLPGGFVYSDELAEFILKDAVNSDIVLKQKSSEFNVLTGEPLIQLLIQQILLVCLQKIPLCPHWVLPLLLL